MVKFGVDLVDRNRLWKRSVSTKRRQRRIGRPKGPPKIRIAAYITPELEVLIINEANEREMTLGDLIEEAFRSRAVFVKKEEEK